MQEVINYLNTNKIGYFATVDNGKPRVRPWGFMFEEGGKFFFCTNNTKDVYRQMKEVPYMEFCCAEPEFKSWLRISGRITIIDDVAVKGKIMDANPMLKGMYQSPDNPIFVAFYIEHGEASLSSFAGAPKKFEF